MRREGKRSKRKRRKWNRKKEKKREKERRIIWINVEKHLLVMNVSISLSANLCLCLCLCVCVWVRVSAYVWMYMYMCLYVCTWRLTVVAFQTYVTINLPPSQLDISCATSVIWQTRGQSILGQRDKKRSGGKEEDRMGWYKKTWINVKKYHLTK